MHTKVHLQPPALHKLGLQLQILADVIQTLTTDDTISTKTLFPEPP